MRYEEPNEMNRWDAPLFLAFYKDNAAALPIDGIWTALHNANVRPNQATITQRAHVPDYLYTLDHATQDIVGCVLAAQSDGVHTLPVSGSPDPIHLPTTKLAVSHLQRFKRQFVTLNRVHTLDESRIRPAFVEYLNGQFLEL